MGSQQFCPARFASSLSRISLTMRQMTGWPNPVVFPSDAERLSLIAAYRAALGRGDEAAVQYMADQPNRYIEPEAFDELLRRIRKFFDAPEMEIILVGSAALGFSPVEKPREGKRAFRGFSEQSDIDLALLDPATFDRYWLAAYRHKNRRPDWPSNLLGEYFFAGWFRPDLAPTTFAMRNQWFDFFRRVSSEVLDFHVTAGLYRSADFLNEYRRKTCRASRGI